MKHIQDVCIATCILAAIAAFTFLVYTTNQHKYELEKLQIECYGERLSNDDRN